ncbi:MAG TPA: FHA domain-containing protein [Bryobacteraceae bacterium]|nr:FHA domain-containing protein [Bryobacteraceae bacterium]
MQLRLTFKHLRGDRANEEDSVALPPEREVLFGRAPECHVRYNEAEELVSLRHLKIVATDEYAIRYIVFDLSSANGTFVDHRRVFGPVFISPGAHVQLGPGGPEFEFGLSVEENNGSQNKNQKALWKTWFAGGKLVMFAFGGLARYFASIRLARLVQSCVV